jgi:hypothetical protein
MDYDGLLKISQILPEVGEKITKDFKYVSFESDEN